MFLHEILRKRDNRLLLSSRAFQRTPKGQCRTHSPWGEGGCSSPCALEGLGLGKYRHGDGGMVGVVEHSGVDEEDEGAGDGGALVASSKTRARAWLTASTMIGTRMCGCRQWRKEAALHEILKRR